MVYPYTVKHNGVWYKAGVEVPDGVTNTNEEVVEKSATFTENRASVKKGRPSKSKE